MIKQNTLGVLYGVIAYTVWGLLPLFWKPLGELDAVVVTAHRLIWSTVTLLIILSVTGKLPKFIEKLREPKTLALSFLTGSLLCGNWIIYIWAVHNGRVVSVSLGYFILPLMYIVIGYFMLKEAMSKLQILAVAIASAGVLMQGIGIGNFPWAAILVAITFAIYGVSKKKMKADGLSILTLEVGLLAPLAIAYLYFYQQQNPNRSVWMDGSASSIALIVLTGAATITPLLFFTGAAKRVPLNLLGMLQFIAPTGQFLLGLMYYHEVINTKQIIAFSLIWIAIIIYSISRTKLVKSKA